jgi:hypothetical protein
MVLAYVLACLLSAAAHSQGRSTGDKTAQSPPPMFRSIAKVYCASDRQTASKSLEITPDGDLILSGHGGRILGRGRLSRRELDDTQRLWRAVSSLPSPPACDSPEPGASLARLELITAERRVHYDARPECPVQRPLRELSSWIGALYRLHLDELTRMPSVAPLAEAALPPAVDLARRDLAARLQIEPSQVALTHLEERLWPDTCLGLPSPELCAPGEMPGYRLVFEALGQAHAYHTDEGTTFRSADLGDHPRSR